MSGGHVLRAEPEEVLGRPADELPEGMTGKAGPEVAGQGLSHRGARAHSLSGAGAPFSVRRGRSGLLAGRIPYAFPCSHRG
jgi:hypothetical protein